MDYQRVLTNLGYARVSDRAEEVLYTATSGAFDAAFGESVSATLLSHMSSTQGLPETKFLRNYDLLESELYRVFGQSAEIILRRIVEYIRHSPYVDIKSARFTIPELLQEIRTRGAEEFFRKAPEHTHILVLYQNSYFKDVAIRSFLDPQTHPGAPRGIFSANPSSVVGVRSMLYSELRQLDRREETRKLWSWILDLHSLNKSEAPTRVALEDKWFLENNRISEIVDLEKSIGRHLGPNMTIVCTYDVSYTSKLREDLAKTLLESHGHVVAEYLADIAVYQVGQS